MKYTAILHPRFLRQFEEILYADPNGKLIQYHNESKSCQRDTASYSQEEIASLEKVKKDMLTRNSIFSSHLVRIEEVLKPWVDAVTTIIIPEADVVDDEDEYSPPQKKLKM